MKLLKNLIDAKQLSKKEQQQIKGGGELGPCVVECLPSAHGCTGHICYGER